MRMLALLADGQTVWVEVRLDGGNAGGAVRAGDTVRRATGPGTPSVHALMAHLAHQGFAGSPRPLGIDAQGREVLTFLEGETTGSALPWSGWVHAEATLVQVAGWLRRYHEAVADFTPPSGAVWRMGGQWAPGLIIGHNDAAPYNAVWREGRLTGFIDWDMAGPVSPQQDLAFAAFSWVPCMPGGSSPGKASSISVPGRADCGCSWPDMAGPGPVRPSWR